MAAKLGGLGRGLDALLIDNSIEELNTAQAVKLKITDIEPNKEQARKQFEPEALAALAQSIEQHGVLQPLLVRPIIGGGYQLIAGERRWRAAKIAGLSQVPVIIRELDDTEAAVISLIENLQREDLNPIEQAQGFASLMNDFGLTQEQASQKVGKSRSAVANSVRLLSLPKPVIEMISSGEITAGHAKALAGLEEQADIIEAAKLIAAKGLSVREAEKMVKALSGGKKEHARKKPQREAFFDEVELSLGNALGRKARVLTKGAKQSGTLQIDFYDKEDLARIAKALGSLE